MDTQIKFNDCRANRNYCFGQYQQICNDVVKSRLGQDREFKGGEMDYNYFKATSWKKDWNDVAVNVFIDFRTHEITITTIN
jgi:hypothetical protein